VLLAGALATSTIAAPLVSQPPSTPTPVGEAQVGEAQVGESQVGESQVGEASPPSAAAPEVRDRYAAVPGAASETHTTNARPEDRARRERVVARVDGVAITVGEIEDLLTVGATEDDVRAALDASIRRVRLTKEAERRGLAAHPEVRASERRALVEVLLVRDFGSHDRPGGADPVAVDALVTRLRAEHVRDVELEPLYPLALDPRPRAMRSAAAVRGASVPSAPAGPTSSARMSEEQPFAEGVVTQEELRPAEPPEEP
jgi:hypothetical protein